MSIIENKTIICESCGKGIQKDSIFPHLVDHVFREYNLRYGDGSKSSIHTDTAQIHDLIMSWYDDLDLVMSNDVINNIVEDFKRVRIRIVLEYGPLSMTLNHSEVKGYFMTTHDGDHINLDGNREENVQNFIDMVNELISYSRMNDYYKVLVSGVPLTTCSLVSYHMKVPKSWLGLPVIIKNESEDFEHTSKPVMCGNSVHVTVPQEWSDKKVTIELGTITQESDFGEIKDA